MRRLLAAALLFAAAPASAQERITSFASDIAIQADGSMRVAETIDVTAENNQIRHGIYRDFPTAYTDTHGLAFRTGFTVQAVTRDGNTEPYHTEAQSNGTRVYIGDSKRLVSRGPHRYVLTYDTTKQIGFFTDHDELYWNVTGNGWEFPINHAEARVALPGGAAFTGDTAYTGPQGSKDRNFTVTQDTKHRLTFAANGLRGHDGLTIVAQFPKGVVHEPTEQEKFRAMLNDNMPLLIGSAGMALLLLYYIPVWLLYGRSPKGLIVPLFAPPAGLSPGAVNYIAHRRFDNCHQDGFAAALVSMAVKGFVKITQTGDAGFKVQKLGGDASALSADEKLIADNFFSDQDSVALESYNAMRVGIAFRRFCKSLKAAYADYFLHNGKKILPGLVISAAALAAIFLLPGSSLFNGGVALFMMVWLSGWTLGCLFLLVIAGSAWYAVAQHKPKSIFLAIFLTCFSIPFLAGEVFGVTEFATATGGWVPAGVVLALMLANGGFYFLLRVPSPKGRAALDQIAGFRLYLAIAEKDRMNMLNAPTMTPAVFERYLPYAIALGVEKAWGAHFAASIPTAQQADYSPAWYSGSALTGAGLAGFAGSLGSGLSSAISSASSPSGGSGGGGSSGGGGGGGGGGGW